MSDIIKLTNDVQVSSESMNIAVDFTNLLSTDRISDANNYHYYTMTQDCYAYFHNANGQSANIKVNDIYWYKHPQGDSTGYNNAYMFLFLRKGDVLGIYTHNYGHTDLAIYGLR